ncbi:hypothetical protein P3T37_004130 [Kitasatospora sp. MAA4]|uniref:hypothetical protein n=1 Tax=Kitasatospora sp. MAA4 TaxID=3035093 RepID=UPI0024740D41|nr:hypothetical protein [Kitasatospora sp. MAA4]MDH6134726.1 hypothetical protein [Kitasatospora sp. MAA4]
MNASTTSTGIPVPIFVVTVALLLSATVAGAGYLFARRDGLSRTSALAWAAGSSTGTTYLLFKTAEVLHIL